jgi:TPR repeat protein
MKPLLKFLAELIAAFAHKADDLKNTRVVNKPDSGWYGWFQAFRQYFDAGAVYGISVAYLDGVLIAIAAILAIVVGFLLVNITRWRRARIFVSFFHEHEDVATAIATHMRGFGLNVVRLPFKEVVDHDELLDDVRAGIAKSDLLICVPGDRPSFVEHEVAMALAINKPLLFVTRSEDLGRIPNTAKKGYPIFNFNSLEEGGWKAFSRFCGYVCGHHMSLVGLCFSALGSFIPFFLMATVASAVVAFATCLLIGKAAVLGNLEWIEYASTTLTVLSFVVPFIVFTRTRLAVAQDIRRSMGRKTFDLGFVPPTMAFKLAKSDVVDILFKGRVVAHHEATSVPTVSIPPTPAGDDGVADLQAKATLGDAASQLAFGEWLLGNVSDASPAVHGIDWIRKAAEQGNIEAQYRLGCLFDAGQGVEANSTRAAHWLRQAAQSGQAQAQNLLGEHYHEGRGIEANNAEALKWYEAAGAQGVAAANYSAGYMYLNGVGVRRDRDKARKLFEQAAANSHALASHALGVIYENGIGICRNRKAAKDHYRAAAATGDTDAAEALKRLTKPSWKFWG